MPQAMLGTWAPQLPAMLSSATIATKIRIRLRPLFSVWRDALHVTAGTDRYTDALVRGPVAAVNPALTNRLYLACVEYTMATTARQMTWTSGLDVLCRSMTPVPLGERATPATSPLFQEDVQDARERGRIS